MLKYINYAVLVILLAISGCHLGPDVASDDFIPEMSNINVSERTDTNFFSSNHDFNFSNEKLAAISDLLKKTRSSGITNIEFLVVSNRALTTQQKNKVRKTILGLMHQHGFINSRIRISGVCVYRDAKPGVRINILRYAVKKPDGNKWSDFIGDVNTNKTIPRMGSSADYNLKSMIANEADLISPRRYRGVRTDIAVSSITGGGGGIGD